MAETPEITVLLADDHEVVREGLRLALLRSPHIRVVGEAPDGETAVSLAERRRPDVIVMDLRMPGMDGIETLGRIRKHDPLLPVILLSGHADVSKAVEAMRHGAVDYLLKPVPVEKLCERIRSSLERRTILEEMGPGGQ